MFLVYIIVLCPKETKNAVSTLKLYPKSGVTNWWIAISYSGSLSQFDVVRLEPSKTLSKKVYLMYRIILTSAKLLIESNICNLNIKNFDTECELKLFAPVHYVEARVRCLLARWYTG